MKTVVKILCWVLAVVLFAGGIAVILAFTNGGNEEFKTFYIERNGEKILASETEDVFDAGETVEYRVKYTFDVGQETKRDYIVKVIPNEAEGFAYTVDGVSMTWKRAGALSGAENSPFEVVKKEDSFTLSCNVDFRDGMYDVLRMLYPNKLIYAEGAFDPKPYFTLYVASYNEAVRFYIHFALVPAESPPVEQGQALSVQWYADNMGLVDTKQFYSGDIIGEYRPKGYEDIKIWYTDFTYTKPFDFFEPITHDLELYAGERTSARYTISTELIFDGVSSLYDSLTNFIDWFTLGKMDGFYREGDEMRFTLSSDLLGAFEDEPEDNVYLTEITLRGESGKVYEGQFDFTPQGSGELVFQMPAENVTLVFKLVGGARYEG